MAVVKKKTAAKKKTSAKQSDPDVQAMRTLRDALRTYSFGLPGAWEDHPWGESVAKVAKKVFVFFGQSTEASLREGVGLSIKLPHSGDLVLSLPFASPTGYGLGRAGWVTVKIPPAEVPPLGMLTGWIDESFRAIAPKKRVAEFDALHPDGSMM